MTRAYAREFSADKNFDVHSTFTPDLIRQGDPLEATLTVLDAAASVLDGSAAELCLQAQVWHLSPFGVELSGLEAAAIPMDSRVRLNIQLPGQKISVCGTVVTPSAADSPLVGVRFTSLTDPDREFEEERRTAARVRCNTLFLPTGVASNPIRFNDFMLFRIHDISRDGMRVTTSLRNKMLLPGMRLDLLVTYPSLGESQVACQVVAPDVITEQGREVVSLGLKFTSVSDAAREMMGQYLLQFGEMNGLAPTARDLKRGGMPVRRLSKSLDFSFVRSHEDYHQVLCLRQKAYSEVVELPADSKPEDWADVYDTRSRILIAKHRGRVVGSSRLIFSEPGEPLEHEKHFRIPDDFPPPQDCVEVTRVCTDPSFRGDDLLTYLLKHITLVAVQAQRYWIIGNAESNLLPIYERIGCHRTKHKYTHTVGDFYSKEHTIFLADLASMCGGLKTGPVVWSQIFPDLWPLLEKQLAPRLSAAAQRRLMLYRFLMPASKILATQFGKRAARKAQRLKKGPGAINA